MNQRKAATGNALLIALVILAASGVCAAEGINVGLGARIAGPQFGELADVDFGMSFNRFSMSSSTSISVWPTAYAVESLELEYLLGRVAVQAETELFFLPVILDSISVGATYTLIDAQGPDQFIQRTTIAAGGDLIWNPFSGFGVAPKVDVCMRSEWIDFCSAVELNNGLIVNLQADWLITPRFSAVTTVDLAIPLSQWGAFGFDIGVGFELDFDFPTVEELLPPPAYDPDVLLDVEEFTTRTSEEQIFFGYTGTGVASVMSVEVYDLAGNVVWFEELTNVTEIVWNRTDVAGNMLARGGYIYVISATDGTGSFNGKGLVFIKR